MAEPLVHLLDGHIYIFRAWFGMPEMRDPEGRNVEAVYGFTNTLLKYLVDEQPSHIACCFDAALESFRNELFPGYKASRAEPPPELERQFALCFEVCAALGVPFFLAPRYEADDVIATLTERAGAEGARTRVVTADKDLSQLVTEDGRVELYDLARDRHVDAEAVRGKFGVTPDQIPDYLALVGDAIDDLPGVPGVGAKSAAAALGVFGSLDGMPAPGNLWEELPIRGARRIGERIARHREQALATRTLATVVRDVPGIRASLAELAWEGAHADRVEELFGGLGWGRIATRIPRWA
jgi:5'-3' exonuclease